MFPEESTRSVSVRTLNLLGGLSMFTASAGVGKECTSAFLNSHRNGKCFTFTIHSTVLVRLTSRYSVIDNIGSVWPTSQNEAVSFRSGRPRWILSNKQGA